MTTPGGAAVNPAATGAIAGAEASHMAAAEAHAKEEKEKQEFFDKRRKELLEENEKRRAEERRSESEISEQISQEWLDKKAKAQKAYQTDPGKAYSDAVDQVAHHQFLYAQSGSMTPDQKARMLAIFNQLGPEEKEKFLKQHLAHTSSPGRKALTSLIFTGPAGFLGFLIGMGMEKWRQNKMTKALEEHRQKDAKALQLDEAVKNDPNFGAAKKAGEQVANGQEVTVSLNKDGTPLGQNSKGGVSAAAAAKKNEQTRLDKQKNQGPTPSG